MERVLAVIAGVGLAELGELLLIYALGMSPLLWRTISGVHNYSQCFWHMLPFRCGEYSVQPNGADWTCTQMPIDFLLLQS